MKSGCSWISFQVQTRLSILAFRRSIHVANRCEFWPWDALIFFCLISEFQSCGSCIDPVHLHPTCCHHHLRRLAGQAVQSPWHSKMSTERPRWKAMRKLVSHFFHCTAANKWEKQSKHEVKTLKFYVKDMNMTRQHVATLVLEFMCCQCSAWLWDLVFSTLEVAASHVAHLMSWRQLHSDQTRKRQTE